MDSRSQGNLTLSGLIDSQSLPVLFLYTPKNGNLKNDHQIEGIHATLKIGTFGNRQ